MSIVGVIGRLGSGKSAFMTALAEDYAEEGFKIYGNYTLVGIPFDLINNSNFQDTIDRSITRNVVIIDELVQNVKTRTINAIDIELVISQIRKFITERSHLVYSVQLYPQIPPDLLLLSDLIVKCYSERTPQGDYISTDLEFYLFDDIKYDLRFYDAREDVDLSYVFGRYNTYEAIRPLTKDFSRVIEKYEKMQLSKSELKALILKRGDANSIAEATRIADMISAERKISES